ncbi:MAG TPA: hypothetical protein VFT43_09655, partial [Candidatus Polarisedimenticolia bacterium]|nr:hypothetical protein [Candidatus Polarisedimenticolia bacterium]
MSASGGKKGHDRPHRRPPEEPDPTSAGDGEDESIEILEVVGVDETTGSEKGQRTPHHSPPPAPRRESPAGDLPRKLEEALEAKDKYYDLLLRKQAEFENFRKR